MYKLNLWLWQFGRGKPRLGGLSVAATEDSRTELLKDCPRHAVEKQAQQGERGCKVTWHCKKGAHANISHVFIPYLRA